MKNTKIHLFFCLALGLFSLETKANISMPIRKHLTDASAINRQRAGTYAKLTNNKSYALSYELIFMETAAKVATFHLNLKAQKYIEKGVGIFSDDLIDMATIPDFRSSFREGETPKSRIPFSTRALSKKWLESIDRDDLKSVYDEAIFLLDEGSLKNTNQNCLTRHFAESIGRAILNYDGHRENAARVNLEDPKDILLDFLKLQIRSLAWAQSLDKRAYPMQAQGVPLFCQDVPAIPYK